MATKTAKNRISYDDLVQKIEDLKNSMTIGNIINSEISYLEKGKTESEQIRSHADQLLYLRLCLLYQPAQ